MTQPAWFCDSCCHLLSRYTDLWEADSWVEISSQPSSSSLSSIADDANTPHNPRFRRRRTSHPAVPSHLHLDSRQDDPSSQEEYDESESESDRVMISSGEGMSHRHPPYGDTDDDDENRTAINHPLRNGGFTPQPNAFSHPPSNGIRYASQPVPGSYCPASSRPATRPFIHRRQSDPRPSHLPHNILSPSYNAAAQHEEALRASLNTLLSCAAAARGLQKADSKRSYLPTQTPLRDNRVEPTTLRLIPGSALPTISPPLPQQHSHEPTFKPTLRRNSTSTTSSSAMHHEKRKAGTTTRSASCNRRAVKKARRSTHSSVDDLTISPTLLTWVVSAGVVVFLSALSFSAGYSIGREAGRLDSAALAGDEQLRICAQEAGRSGLGLKRSLARSAVQV